MAGVLQVRVGDGVLLVETVPVAGSEPTSRVGDAIDGVVDAFTAVRGAIVELAESTAETIGEATRRGAQPDGVEVEFGLKFSAHGNVLLAGASGEATLRVKLTYARDMASGDARGVH